MTKSQTVKKQSEREIKRTKRSIATEDPALRSVPGPSEAPDLLADESKPKRHAKSCSSRGAFGHCWLEISGYTLVWCRGIVALRYVSSCDVL